MVVPFGFSFGDMVSGISLVKDLIRALQDSGGATADYRGLMSELYGLERALIAIKELSLPEDADGYQAVRQAVGQCQICVDRFLQNVTKYQPLSAGTTTLKDAVKKVKWVLCRREDLLKFRQSLGIQSSSMNLLLSALHLSRSATQDIRMNASLMQQSSVLRKMQIDMHDGALEQMNLLKQIERLLKNPHTGKDTPPDDYVVRPLRLTGAPISPGFVGRPEVMQSIEQNLLPLDCDRQKILVLQGLGGIGKSQIAREFATVHQHDFTSIFWANATSKQSLKDSMAQIAERIPLSKSLNAEGRVGKGTGEIAMAITAVIEWFSKPGNNQWLLILDNADNQEQGSKNGIDDHAVTDAYDIYEYLPFSSHGTLLVTSRLASLGRYLGGTTLRVEEMTMNEGLELLAKASARPMNEDGAIDIVDKLGCYPFALSQAGRFIFENQISCRKYLEKYEKRIIALLKQKPNTREYEHGSIATTLTLSYDVLKYKNPTAAAFLSMCAYFDNTDISWTILGTCYKAYRTGWQSAPWGAPGNLSCDWIPELPENWLDSVTCDEVGFEGVIRALHEFSFVRRNGALDSVTIHPLVHEWLISSNDQGSRSRFLIVATDTVALNIGAYSKISNSRLTSHADRCLALAKDGLQLATWDTWSLFFFAALYHDQSQPSKARLLISEISNRLHAKHGVWNRLELRWTLHTMTIDIHNRAIHRHVTELHDIEKAISISVLEAQNRLYADLRLQLTFAYLVQEDFESAREVCLETVETLQNVSLDARMCCCLTAALAECFLQTGNFERSLQLTGLALELFHRIYGHDDPDDSGILEWSLRIIMIHAIALTRAGQYEQADSYFTRALAGYHLTRGPEHPLTKLAVENQNLARLKSSNGLKTDVHIPYMRWDLAMGVFEPTNMSVTLTMEDILPKVSRWYQRRPRG